MHRAKCKRYARGELSIGNVQCGRPTLALAGQMRCSSYPDPALDGPRLQHYRGDLQMHSEWSDGTPTVQEIADACLARGYAYAAVTDHSYGLTIAGGMSMAEAAGQRAAVDAVNARNGPRRRYSPQ